MVRFADLLFLIYKKTDAWFIIKIIFISHVLIGCTAKTQFVVDTSNSSKDVSSYTLSGEFPLFQELSLQSRTKNQSVFQKSCSSPTVTLHEIDSNGEIEQEALATTSVTSSGQFQFNLPKSAVNGNASSTAKAMVVQISGCQNEVYLRPVTGLQQQKVTAASTVISYLFNSALKSDVKSLLESTPTEIAQLISSIESAADFSAAQQLLGSNSTAQNKLNDLFSSTANVFNDVSPMVTASALPETASESVAIQLSVTTKHFSTTYQPLYVWKLNNQVIGNQASLQWTPTANMQGSHNLSVMIGIDDGQGQIDQTKPFKQLSKTIVVDNHLLPTAPNLSVVSPTIVNSDPISQRNLTLGIATGAMLSECQSFSYLAITENTTTIPSANDFTIECTDANIQNLTYQLTTNGDGVKTLRLWAKDASGVISENPSLLSLSLDTGAPTAIISTTPLAKSKLNTQSFEFSATDDGGVISYYQCQLDSTGWENCTSPKIYQSLTEGNHTFQLKAIDSAGNESVVVEKNWLVDLTNPSIQLTHQPASITNELSATFQFLGSDSGGSGVDSYECQINNGSYVTCSSPLIEVMTAGQKVIKVKSVDQAGNKSDAVEYLWTIDTTAPTVSITNQPASLTNATTASLSFLGTDTGGASISGYQCSFNGSSFTTCSSPNSYNSLSAGIQDFSVKAVDSAGNIGQAVSYQWTVDLTTPMASITSSPNTLTNAITAQFEFSATPPAGGSITGYECLMNSGAWESCASPNNISGLSEGVQTFQVRSIDNNNNRSQATSYQWTIDTTLPVLSIQSSPTSLNNLTATAISFSATDANSISGYQCQINGGQYSSCASPLNLSDLSTAVQTVNIQAIDLAGNLSQATAVTWTTDLLSPTTVIQTSPQSVNNSTTATVTFTGSDFGGGAVSRFECSSDQNSYNTCTSPYQLSQLSVGVQQIYIRAVDTAGNVGNAVSASWIIDQTNPIVSIQTTIASLTNSSSQSISFSGSDTGGGSIDRYECAMDAEAFSTCTSPINYTGLVEGSRQFKVKAIDTAGNVSDVQTVNWTIDLTAPSLSITTPSTNESVAQTSGLNNFALGGTCSENGRSVVLGGSVSGTATCTSSIWSTSVDISGISDGTISVTATQSDIAENSTTTSARAIIKDTVAPVIAVTTPTALKGNSATGAVNFTLTETNVANSTNFNIEIYNGTSWSSIGTKSATAGLNSNVAYAHSSFNVPSVDVSIARLRVTLVDAAGNSTTTQTNDFIIDSTAPTLTSLTINDGATYAGTSIVSFKLDTIDNYSSGNQLSYRLSLANTATSDCQSEYLDSGWDNWQSSSSEIAYTISPVDGIKKICAWVKDAVGNTSVHSPTQGTLGITFDTIEYSAGNLPIISNFTVTNMSTGLYSATVGQGLTINWQATDIEGLANNAINIAYTTDNSTWKDAYTNLDINQVANQTWVGGLSGNPTSASGTIANIVSPSSSFFRFKIIAKDESGNTSAIVNSQTFNTGNWSVYAGSRDRGDNGIGKSAVLTSEAGTTNFAIHPLTGDFYASDTKSGLRKLDAKTGLVSTLIKNGTSNLSISGGALPANPLFPQSINTNPMFDSKGRLYIALSQTGGWGSVIYQIDLVNNTSRIYAGGGLNSDGGYIASQLQIAPGGYAFDEQDSLYVWTLCGDSLIPNNFLIYEVTPKRIVKIAQNADGTAGTTTRILGGSTCSNTNPTSGQVAVNQPGTNVRYPNVSHIVPINSGQAILIGNYGSHTDYKIINGIVYSTNLSLGGFDPLTYNPSDGKIYRVASGSQVEKITLNTSGANGETAQIAFYMNSQNSGCTDDGVNASNYCGMIGARVQFRNGIMYFSDGSKLNGMSDFAIRYFDQNGQLQTLFGGKPFYGDGQFKTLSRGTFSGIYYKKASEPNQTAFPEGLYFMEKSGIVFGHIHPTTGIVTHLWGNQSRITASVTNGEVISKQKSLGEAYFGGTGFPLTFDNEGLPWIRATGHDVLSVNNLGQVVKKTTGGPVMVQSAGSNINVNPANYGMWPYGGLTNFTTAGNGLFMMSNYVYTGLDPIISIRYMDFTNSKIPIVIGGNYLASQSVAASADVTTPGSVLNAPLSTTCQGNKYDCFIFYDVTSDRLYFSEGSKIRYISSPTDTSLSTLTTLFTASSQISNFALTPDRKQLWFIRAGGVYCYDISSGKSWCNTTTDHFTIRTAAGWGITDGANQLTFKDNQTLFLSTYNGEILQFNLPVDP